MRKTKIVIVLVLLMCACKKEANVSLLEFVGTITVPAQSEPFIARDHFKVDTSENAVVQIAYLGYDFKAWFLDKTESPKSETTLCCRKLQKASLDASIIAELGGEAKVQTSLAELFYLLKQQSRGQTGILLTNGNANIFYILDNKGVLRAVYAHRHDGGWCVFAYSVTDPDEWDGGHQVFSRNF